MLWLFTMVLVVAGTAGVGVAAGIVAVSTGLPVERALMLLSDQKSSPLVTSPTWIAISVLVSEAMIGLVVWRFLRRHRLFLREACPLRVPSLRDVVGALLCVFGLSPLANMLAELVRRQLPRGVNAETVIVALARDVTLLELLGVILATALVPAIFEELLFRGLLTRAFLGRGNLLALSVPSLMFGVFHLDPTQAAGTFVLGIGFGIARLYTDSVLTSIMCHFVYNAYVLVDVFAGGQIGGTELYLGRVGLGLSLAALGFGLIVLDPGERRR